MAEAEKRNARRTSAAIQTLFIVFTPLLLAFLMLRNLGGIVGLFIESDADAKFDFARIFDQTKDARITLAWLPSLLLGCAFYAFLRFLLPKLKSRVLRVLLNILLFALFFVCALLLSLLLTRVNQIEFFDLLRELLPLIDKL